MRRVVDAQRVRAFLTALGRRTTTPTTVYLTGGAIAVLHGWRSSTIDIDLKLQPDPEELYRAIRDLKEELEINVELASPDLFIPVADGWQDRSPWIGSFDAVEARHFDLVAQALAPRTSTSRRQPSGRTSSGWAQPSPSSTPS